MSSDAITASADGETGDEMSEAREEKALGFWIYLMGDAVIFALLFATYAVMVRNTAGGPSGKELFALPNVLMETLVLLTSTLTFSFASLAMNAQRQRQLVFWLVVTAILGVVFVSLELNEFAGMISTGAGPDRSGFLSAFFTLVGTHGLHVSAGLIWLVVMLVQIAVKGLTPPVTSRLARLAQFWHFLDIVWIAIFSVVYLPGVL